MSLTSPSNEFGPRDMHSASESMTRSSLLLRVKAGDEQAWNDFDRLYRRLLHGYARPYRLAPDAVDDVVQECMIKLTKRMMDFVYERGGKKNRFRNFLRVILKHCVYDYWCRQQTHRVGLCQDENLVTNYVRPADEELRENMLQTELYTFVLAVLEHWRKTGNPKPERVQAFDLLCIQGQSVDEVSRRLGIKVDRLYEIKYVLTNRMRKEIEIIRNDM